jgi:hypothetical protein
MAEGDRYDRRNQAETAMFRYKHLIGPKLHARSLPAQRGEVTIAVAVLNKMIRTAKPVSVRVAQTAPGKGQLSPALARATTPFCLGDTVAAVLV